MTNLKLVTTETFGDLPCNFYRNMNDDILLTREQIGQALEYSDPMIAIGKIHNRHKIRLDNFSFTKMVNGHETYYYTEKGVMEICRWSKSNKADEFMDWVWDIIEKYRHNNLQLQSNLQPLIDSLSLLTQTITTMQQDISALKESQIAKKLPEKKYSRWKTNTFNKLNTLKSYVNTHSEENLSLPQIIHLVIQETEDTYGIDVNDYVEAYKSEFDLETNPYVIDVINYYKDIRDMFTLALNSIMDKLHLTNEKDSITNKNIFDVLADEINKDI